METIRKRYLYERRKLEKMSTQARIKRLEREYRDLDRRVTALEENQNTTKERSC